MNIYKKTSLFFLVFSVITFGIFSLSHKPKVESQSSINPVEGYAWSDNIGWIEMMAVQKNGVGNLTGYAWSDNIGWIKFNPTGPYPTEAGNSQIPAKMNANGTLSGWIRACAGQNDKNVPPPNQGVPNNTCTGESRTDGWDGWISLKGTDYGITLTEDTQPFCQSNSCPGTDFAWGSDVVGWIDFSGVTADDGNTTESENGTIKVIRTSSGALPDGDCRIGGFAVTCGTAVTKETGTYIIGTDTAAGYEISYVVVSCTSGICDTEQSVFGNIVNYHLSNNENVTVTFTYALAGVGEPSSCSTPVPSGSGVTKGDANFVPPAVPPQPAWDYISYTPPTLPSLGSCQWTCKPGYKPVLDEFKCRPIPGYEEI